MIKYQKIVKYLSICFATLLIVNIFYMIGFGLSSFGDILNLQSTGDEKINIEELDDLISYEVSSFISQLEIEVKTSHLLFQVGEKFGVSSDEKSNFLVNEKGNKLVIKEKDGLFFGNNKQKHLVITIPSSFIFDEISIETGAGVVQMDGLSTQELSLELGAGEVFINSIYVYRKTEIDGGAGSINIKSGKLNNLDLDMGIGKLNLTSFITGKSEIDSGIGEISLKLLGNVSDYSIRVNKGIGSVTIDKEEMKDAMLFGTGANFIELNGGIGKIEVSF